MFGKSDQQPNRRNPSEGTNRYSVPRVNFTALSNVEEIEIPSLKVLDNIVCIAQSKSISFEKVVFVGVQHILNTTASLFQALIQLGATPDKMYFSGKRSSGQ